MRVLKAILLLARGINVMMVGTQKICSLIIEQTTGFSFISIVVFTKKTGTADICILDIGVSFRLCRVSAFRCYV